MEIKSTVLHVGATAPFSIVHITDTHLTYADERDGERKIDLARRRAAFFPDSEAVLRLASETAKAHGAVIVHTGDLIDFVSARNLERAKQFTDENDCFLSAGNHEFSLYVGEAIEDEAYRNQSLAAVQSCFKNDIRMSSRVINGVNFIALDDGYYRFDAAQAEFLKSEAAKGLPMILVMHNPLFEREMYDRSMTRNPCAYLTAVPEELMQGYPESRYIQQKADDVTRETVAYILSEPLIKAVIAGHVHYNYEGVLENGIPQIVTSLSDVRVITVT